MAHFEYIDPNDPDNVLRKQWGNYRYVSDDPNAGYQYFFSTPDPENGAVFDWTQARQRSDGTWFVGGGDSWGIFNPATSDVTVGGQSGENSTNIFGVDVPNWAPTALQVGGGLLMAGGLASALGAFGAAPTGVNAGIDATMIGAETGAGSYGAIPSTTGAGGWGSWGAGNNVLGLGSGVGGPGSAPLWGEGAGVVGSGGADWATTAGLEGAGALGEAVIDTTAAGGGNWLSSLFGAGSSATPWVTAAGTLAGAGLNYLGSSNMADAYKSSADSSVATQAAAQRQANDMIWKMYQQNQANNQPWLTAGTKAVNELSTLMQPGGELYNTQYKNFEYGPTYTGPADLTHTNYVAPEDFSYKDFNFTPEDFLAGKDPGYEWRKSQGQNALSAGAAAAGNYGSGNLGTALIDYGQNAASGEYQNAYARALGSYGTNLNKDYSAYNTNLAKGLNEYTTNWNTDLANYNTNYNKNYQDYWANYNKALNEYKDQYSNWLTGQNTLYNRLAGLSGSGQTSANVLGTMGQNTANTIGNNLTSGALNMSNANALGTVGSANALNSGMAGISNQIQSGLGLYANYLNQQQLMNLLAGK